MPYGFAGGPIGGAVGSGVRISLKELCLDQHLAIATLVEAGSSEKSSRAAVCDCADMGLVLGDMLDAGACSALCLRIVASHLPKHDFVSYVLRAQLSAVKVTIGGQALTIAGALAGRTPYQASGNLFADLW
jgi:hypothetical protein